MSHFPNTPRRVCGVGLIDKNMAVLLCIRLLAGHPGGGKFTTEAAAKPISCLLATSNLALPRGKSLYMYTLTPRTRTDYPGRVSSILRSMEVRDIHMCRHEILVLFIPQSVIPDLSASNPHLPFHSLPPFNPPKDEQERRAGERSRGRAGEG